MSNEKDLGKLFGVSHLLSKKSMLDETKEDLMSKKPNDLCLEILSLLEQINNYIMVSNIDGVLKCIAGIKLRSECLEEIALQIKRIIDSSGGSGLV